MKYFSPRPTRDMDSFDQHILTLLQRDASISLKDLAEAVNLSLSLIHI